MELFLILAAIAITIFAMTRSLEWFDNRKVKHKHTEKPRRKQHYYERYPNAQKRDPFAIPAHVHAIANQLEAYKEQQERSERGKAFRERLTIAGVTITALLAFGQGWIFWGQLEEMRGEKRAWVGPLQAGFDTAIAENADLSVNIKYNNTGREPARDMFYGTTHFFVNEDQDRAGITKAQIKVFSEQCYRTPPTMGYTVVFPTSGFSNYTITHQISKIDIDYDVIYGVKFIVLMGCFVYRTNEEIHRTVYCFFFRNGRTQNQFWAFCPDGNYAD